LTFAYRREHSVDTGLVRIFNSYGPRMRSDDGRMIPTFLRQAVRGEPLTITGDGTQTRSVCYVDDTVRGLIALADSDFPGPVNIGNPHELTVLEIADHVLRVTSSRSSIRHVEPMTDDPRRRCPDISLAEQVLGWKPEVDIEDGLRRTARRSFDRPIAG
jgi:dTDP-glucose 4,6-dehydratase